MTSQEIELSALLKQRLDTYYLNSELNQMLDEVFIQYMLTGFHLPHSQKIWILEPYNPDTFASEDVIILIRNNRIVGQALRVEANLFLYRLNRIVQVSTLEKLKELYNYDNIYSGKVNPEALKNLFSSKQRMYLIIYIVIILIGLIMFK